MSHNFKPGDLAIIIGCTRNPRNIGVTVELIEFIDPGQRAADFHPLSGKRYISIASGPGWLVSGEALSESGAAICLEKHLMPLRGDFEPEQQKTKEAEPCA